MHTRVNTGTCVCVSCTHTDAHLHPHQLTAEIRQSWPHRQLGCWSPGKWALRSALTSTPRDPKGFVSPKNKSLKRSRMSKGKQDLLYAIILSRAASLIS